MGARAQWQEWRASQANAENSGLVAITDLFIEYVLE
jgi:hypothetical protein